MTCAFLDIFHEIHPICLFVEEQMFKMLKPLKISFWLSNLHKRNTVENIKYDQFCIQGVNNTLGLIWWTLQDSPESEGSRFFQECFGEPAIFVLPPLNLYQQCTSDRQTRASGLNRTDMLCTVFVLVKTQQINTYCLNISEYTYHYLEKDR